MAVVEIKYDDVSLSITDNGSILTMDRSLKQEPDDPTTFDVHLGKDRDFVQAHLHVRNDGTEAAKLIFTRISLHSQTPRIPEADRTDILGKSELCIYLGEENANDGLEDIVLTTKPESISKIRFNFVV